MKKLLNKLGISMLALLLVSVVMPIVNAESGMSTRVIEKSETINTFNVGNIKITVDTCQDFSSAYLILKYGGITDKYTVKLETLDNIYIAKIYDVDGKIVRTRQYSSNPLISLDGNHPVIIKGILVDASIDISPDKYDYDKDEEGTINIHVDNYAIPSGYTNYYLKIPENVEYIEVYDGEKPNYVFDLPTSDDIIYLPDCGLKGIKGPATVLYWSALHTFGYEEKIKVKVKYDSTGSFTPYAFDTEQEILSGLSAWDEDSFKVTVS
jgi:hypothetical protein